jgi:hypothetical protein
MSYSKEGSNHTMGQKLSEIPLTDNLPAGAGKASTHKDLVIQAIECAEEKKNELRRFIKIFAEIHTDRTKNSLYEVQESAKRLRDASDQATKNLLDFLGNYNLWAQKNPELVPSYSIPLKLSEASGKLGKAVILNTKLDQEAMTKALNDFLNNISQLKHSEAVYLYQENLYKLTNCALSLGKKADRLQYSENAMMQDMKAGNLPGKYATGVDRSTVFDAPPIAPGADPLQDTIEGMIQCFVYNPEFKGITTYDQLREMEEVDLRQRAAANKQSAEANQKLIEDAKVRLGIYKDLVIQAIERAEGKKNELRRFIKEYAKICDDQRCNSLNEVREYASECRKEAEIKRTCLYDFLKGSKVWVQGSFSCILKLQGVYLGTVSQKLVEATEEFGQAIGLYIRSEVVAAPIHEGSGSLGEKRSLRDFCSKVGPSDDLGLSDYPKELRSAIETLLSAMKESENSSIPCIYQNYLCRLKREAVGAQEWADVFHLFEDKMMQDMKNGEPYGSYARGWDRTPGTAGINFTKPMAEPLLDTILETINECLIDALELKRITDTQDIFDEMKASLYQRAKANEASAKANQKLIDDAEQYLIANK